MNDLIKRFPILNELKDDVVKTLPEKENHIYKLKFQKILKGKSLNKPGKHRIGVTNKRFISYQPTKKSPYKVQINRRGMKKTYKTFKSLKKAIEYRDKFCSENNIIFK